MAFVPVVLPPLVICCLATLPIILFIVILRYINKAFDSVNHTVLIRVLKTSDFGEHLLFGF